jgi:hypothetical protein
MRLGRAAPHAVRLGGGGALVVGNDTGGCVRDNSVLTEAWSRWDADGFGWISNTDLDDARADFAVVTLLDGRVLSTGGVDRGNTPAMYRLTATDEEPPADAGHRSIASTYVYDPAADEPDWVRVASLGTPRTGPSAVALLDGRVLVAGGYYLGGSVTGAGTGSAAALAVYRTSPPTGAATPGPVLDNDGPPPNIVPAMATAELYDPSTDTWSATGPMRYARYEAVAATLADGRVLVVGSGGTGDQWLRWNFSQIEVADRVYMTAELYDPGTGRFGLTGALPPIDWSAMETLGVGDPEDTNSSRPMDQGTLIALADGGALLVGRTSEWWAYGDGKETQGVIVRTLRFDPVTGSWSEIDRTIEIVWADTQLTGVVSQGHVSYRPLAGRLGDGRVLVAGGQHVSGPDHLVALETAELYDPDADSWTALPPMPEHRAGGAAVTLGDGSVLLVGGYYETRQSWDCSEGPTGLVSTVRFVPGP